MSDHYPIFLKNRRGPIFYFLISSGNLEVAAASRPVGIICSVSTVRDWCMVDYGGGAKIIIS